MSHIPEIKPALPPRLSFRFARDDERLALRFGPPWARNVFMVIWLIGWTVGCIFLTGAAIKEQTLLLFLFAIPFWASWIFVFFIVLIQFLNREYILLDRDGLAFERCILIRYSTRRVPFEEIKGFKSYVKINNEDGAPFVEGFEVRTLGQSVRFGEASSDDEKNWLVDQLNVHWKSLQRDRPDEAADTTHQMVEENGPGKKVETVELSAIEPIPAGGRLLLTPSKIPIAPPSDCRWTRIEEIHDIILLQKGKFSLVAVGLLLFINAFWNGSTAAGVVNVFGMMPGLPLPGWGLFLFLIPFEAVGLLMVLALLIQLFEPFRRTRWTFGRGEIERRWTWLGMGSRRRYEFPGLDRLEIGNTGKNSLFSCSIGVERDRGSSFQLVLIDANHQELCAVKHLTEGEARWMGDVLLRERPLWFRSSYSSSRSA